MKNFLIACLFTLSLLGITATVQGTKGAHPSHAERPTAVVTKEASYYPHFTAPPIAEVISYLEYHQQVEFFLSSLTPTPPPQPEPTLPIAQSAMVPSGGGGGAHSDAWWHGVAICEQGGANDPYFGYFSFMDGSQGGKPWADQVAAGNALGEGAWAPACVAAGYAASPGG